MNPIEQVQWTDVIRTMAFATLLLTNLYGIRVCSKPESGGLGLRASATAFHLASAVWAINSLVS